MSEKVEVMVRLPAELKGAVFGEAQRDGSSMQDVIVGYLAGQMGVEHELSGRRTRKVTASPHVYLRMPAKLKDRLFYEAAANRWSLTDEIGHRLSERYGLAWQRMGTRTIPGGGGRPAA